MVSAFEVGYTGESMVVQWLQDAGFTVPRWDTYSPGSTDIEAESSGKRLLIQVKSAVYPNEPSSLSREEETKIRSRAKRLGAEAWEARVQLREDIPYDPPRPAGMYRIQAPRPAGMYGIQAPRPPESASFELSREIMWRQLL